MELQRRPLFSFVVVSILISASQVVGENPTLLVVVLGHLSEWVAKT
jgi:hypothetical protein